MPIYDYQCNCGVRFECWRKVSDRKHANCPRCGQDAALVPSAPAFHLDPVSGDFPTRTDQWARQHVQANMDDLKQQGLRPSSGISGVGING